MRLVGVAHFGRDHREGGCRQGGVVDGDAFVVSKLRRLAATFDLLARQHQGEQRSACLHTWWR